MTIALLIIALLGCGGLCAWVYLRREFAVRSRPVLLALRLLAVTGVVVLLWNPTLSRPTRSDMPERVAVLDASASMAARTAEGTALWDLARERARMWAGEGARILVAGSTVRALDPDSLSALEPAATGSLLAEAVTVAAEAGAREVVLITDGRIGDPVATALAGWRLGVELSVDSLAGAGPNAGLARLVVPATVAGGDPVAGRVEVEGWNVVDSLTVAIAVNGEPVRRLRLPAPAEGATQGTDFELPTISDAGTYRVTARIEEEDAFARDDERSAIVRVDPEETGVLLVSFAGDWEPRYLLPVLDQVTGLPVRGFVRTGPDRFQPMNPGPAGDSPAIDGATLGRMLRRAGMVVALGVSAAEASLLEEATLRTRRMLIFPLDGVGAAMAGVATTAPLQGEWYPDAPPSSPIAGEVEAFAAAGLPPLTDLLPLVGTEEGGAALTLRRGGAGEPLPALVLRSGAGKRVGVVLARGFWRWAFRGGEAREHYRRLWAATAGWLMADEALATGPGIRPADPILPVTDPVPWVARGYEDEEIALYLADARGAPVLDSSLVVPPGGSFATPSLPPGSYRYVAVASSAPPSALPDSAAPPLSDTLAGSFEIESFTPEMLILPTDPVTLSLRTATDRAPVTGRRPLRTWPFAWLLILTAIAAEWIGRRRAGLR